MLSNSHGRDVKAAALIGMPKTITEFQTAMGEDNLANPDISHSDLDLGCKSGFQPMITRVF